MIMKETSGGAILRILGGKHTSGICFTPSMVCTVHVCPCHVMTGPDFAPPNVVRSRTERLQAFCCRDCLQVLQ